MFGFVISIGQVILFVSILCKLLNEKYLIIVMLYWVNIVNIAPNVVYYVNDDLLMLAPSISTTYALNFGWLLCSTEANNNAYFCIVVGDVLLSFLPLQSAKPPSTIIYNHIRVDRESGLLLSMDYSLSSWHIAPVIKISWKNISTLRERRSGRHLRPNKRPPRHCRLHMVIYYRLVRRGGIQKSANDDYPRH